MAEEEQPTDVVEGQVIVPAEGQEELVAEVVVPAEVQEFMQAPTEADHAAIELAFLSGDFGQLKPVYRRRLIQEMCKTLGVRIELRPFAWGTVADGKGGKKLVPIPTKALYSQQRANSKTSLFVKDFYIDETLKIALVQMESSTPHPNGVIQRDEDIGVVGIAGPTMGPNGPLPGILTGDKLADALMTAFTRAKNRVTGSAISGPSGPTDDVVAAGLLTSGQKPGEITAQVDPEGPRRIDPNRGKLRRLAPKDAAPQAGVESSDATAEDMAAVTDDVPEAAQTAPVEAPKPTAPKEPPPVRTVPPAGYKGPVAASRPTGAPKPPSPRPGGPVPSKAAPVAAAPRVAPGPPHPISKAPVKAPPKR